MCLTFSMFTSNETKEAFESNVGHYKSMKQTYNLQPTQKPTNFSEEIIKLLLSKKKLSELADDTQNIFKQTNIDRYIDKPRKTFCGEMCSALGCFCHSSFSAY